MISARLAVGVVSLVLLAIPFATSGTEPNEMLSAEDISLEIRDRFHGPALRSSAFDPRPWTSYNQWVCFDTDRLQLITTSIEMNHQWTDWPELLVELPGQSFRFSPEVDLPITASRVLDEWSEYLRNSRQVCIFAAFLQYVAEDQARESSGLWILQKFKTENGYWNVPTSTDEPGESADDSETATAGE